MRETSVDSEPAEAAKPRWVLDPHLDAYNGGWRLASVSLLRRSCDVLIGQRRHRSDLRLASSIK
jgi:hypothetical protein